MEDIPFSLIANLLAFFFEKRTFTSFQDQSQKKSTMNITILSRKKM